MNQTEKQFECPKAAVTSAMNDLQIAVDEALRETAEAKRAEKIACDERDALMKSVLQQEQREKALLAQTARDACEIAELKQSMGGVYRTVAENPIPLWVG